ncbi:MAG: YdcF family protein [Burkholderiales bacterium]|nr:YdcF family protein [Burkholderiales bacterium]
MLSQEILTNGLILWNYHCRIDRLELAPQRERIILGLGSYDLNVADYCAALYLQGYAQKLMFSGKSGNWTQGRWDKTEAEIFAERANVLAVPLSEIILEKAATNLGENIRYSRAIIEQILPSLSEVILVAKPNTTRRAYATFMANWPQIPVRVLAPKREFDDSLVGHSQEDLIHELVGDTQRIIDYPQRGFQIPQDIPENVLQAFEFLYQAGFVQHCQK